MVTHLNQMIGGWANYFCMGTVTKAYRTVEQHVCNRLRQWLGKKHKMPGRATSRFPNEYLHQNLGLIDLGVRKARFSWAMT